MKLTIVTPSYNQSSFIASTIHSVLSQKGDFYLDYIIQDGGSTDGTVDVINDTYKIIKNTSGHNLRLIQENDNGQYDAINKGFNKSDGEIMAWINSDDVYTPWSFSVVIDIFKKFPEIDWIIGAPLILNTQGQVINLPITKTYPNKLLHKGLNINDNFRYSRGWIGQDSVFWRRSLWEKSGGFLNNSYNFAADYDLWLRFSQYSELCSVMSPLAGFRIQPNQKTSNQQAYNDEVLLIHNKFGYGRITEEESVLRKTMSRICENYDKTCIRIAEEMQLVEYANNIVFDKSSSAWRKRKLFAI